MRTVYPTAEPAYWNVIVAELLTMLGTAINWPTDVGATPAQILLIAKGPK